MKNKIFKMLFCIIKYIYYYFYCKIKKINNNDLWLISERGTDARDNSYHLYKYIKNNHPEINIKYVININSVDAKKIHNEDIINYGSKEHYIYFLTAGKLISTHIMGYSPDMSIFWRLDKYHLLKIKGKKIMLQHGITQNYIEFMSKKIANLDLFICGAYPEYNYILNNYGYDENIVKYTGFARYDNLINEEKNQILVMPTFRKWLNYESNFTQTEYFIKWNSLLNNNKLIKYLEDNNLTLIFYPHYEIQKNLHHFSSKSDKVIIADFNHFDVQQLLKESKMLITDYSSVFFDFGYMKKPVFYYQFDNKKFRQHHYQEGYFNYKTMGFGSINKKEDELVNKIINYNSNENNFKRNLEFFQLYDKNNCNRIYKEIIKL